MKTHVLLNGSSAGLASVIRIDTTVGFLSDRREIVDLSPIMPQVNSGYVWRRVFQRRRS